MTTFKGAYTALVTPFTADGSAVDIERLAESIRHQAAGGITGVVPCGTTGEAPTLTDQEHRAVVEKAVELASAEGLQVIAGAGSNNTEHAIHLHRFAQAAGADAALHVSPYYNKPTQEGLYRHFKAIHDAVDLPLVIYNIPGRSVVDMSVETMARLALLPNIVGVKDASNDPVRPLKTRIACGPDFVQLSGEDPSVLALLANGGHGCISVTGNVAPRQCAEMHNAWAADDHAAALAIQQRLQPLHEALFMEASPSAVKYAASLLDLCSPAVRLPLVEVLPETKTRVEAALRSSGVLN